MDASPFMHSMGKESKIFVVWKPPLVIILENIVRKPGMIFMSAKIPKKIVECHGS